MAAKARELAPDELGIEYSQDWHPSGHPLLTIAVRGDVVLDAIAQDEIDATIAGAGRRAVMRAVQPTHVVTVRPKWRTDRVRTFDPDRVGGKPAGELDGAPYWELSERIQTNRPQDCPDCRRSLIGDGPPGREFLRCPQAIAKPDLKPHPGDVMACGLEG